MTAFALWRPAARKGRTMQKLTDYEQARGGRVLLCTSTRREDLHAWLEGIGAAHGGRTLVDTWEIPQHPDGKGGLFTLYACTVVLLAGAVEQAVMELEAA